MLDEKKLEKIILKYGREFWGIPFEERNPKIGEFWGSGFMCMPEGENFFEYKTGLDLLKDLEKSDKPTFNNEVDEVGVQNVSILGWDTDFNFGYNPKTEKCFEYCTSDITLNDIKIFREKYPSCILINYCAFGDITVIVK